MTDKPFIPQLAVFDLDHTLLNVNSSYAFGKYLCRKGLITWSQAFFLTSVYSFQKLGIYSVQKLHQTIFNRLFLGKEAAFFSSLTQQFLQECLPSLLFHPVSAALEQLRRQGCHLAIFSSGPDFIVRAFAEYFQVEHVLATGYHADEKGNFSFLGAVVRGEDKAEALKKLAAELLLPSSSTIAYSDSILDRELLLAADHAVVVRPKGFLWRRYCRQQQWSIIS